MGLSLSSAATAQAEQSFEAFSFLYLNLLTKIRVARSLYRQQTFPSAVSLSLAKNNLVRRIKNGSTEPYSMLPHFDLPREAAARARGRRAEVRSSWKKLLR